MDNLNLSLLGLLPSEEKTYLALLKSGPSTAGPLAKETGLNRVSIYKALEKLSGLGLISYKISANRKEYEASNPKQMQSLIKEKENQFLELKNKIPLLAQIFKKNNNDLEVNIYKGMKGAKNIWDLLLEDVNSGEEWLVVGAPKSADLFAGYFKEFNIKRARKNVLMKIIYNKDARDLIKERKKQKLIKLKTMPKEYITPVSFEVIGNSTLIVMYEPEIIIFHIKNKQVSNSFKTYFDLLWKVAG